MPDSWSVWRAELDHPTPEERRLDRPTEPSQINGYWRVPGARTKHDIPVLIWTKAGATATIFQIGNRRPRNTTEDAEAWERFVSGMWLSCNAVPKADWDHALKEGRWPDGKPAKEMDVDEKLGVEVARGTGDGNEPTVEESLETQIKALSTKIMSVAEPTTQEEADALSELLVKLKRLLDLAEAERVKEKEPFLQGGRDVDAKWQAIGRPGGDAYREGTARKKSFLKKEQDRREAEARAENKRRREEAEAAAKAERERIAEETRQRLAAEAAKEAAEQGIPSSEVISEDEIAQRADEAAAEAVPAPVIEEVQPERPTSGPAYGRQTGLKKVKKGKIEDGPLFLAKLWENGNEDLKALAQKLANRAAKAGIKVDGMVVEEVWE